MSLCGQTNEEIADVLYRIAALLEAQGALSYRVNAYRRAARTVEVLEQSVVEMADSTEGETLEALPDIGKSIAGSIRELVHTGRLGLLDRLEGQISPEDLFTTVPGIGEELAKRIHAELEIETLEELNGVTGEIWPCALHERVRLHPQIGGPHWILSLLFLTTSLDGSSRH